jgi:hypothetical protein
MRLLEENAAVRNRLGFPMSHRQALHSSADDRIQFFEGGAVTVTTGRAECWPRHEPSPAGSRLEPGQTLGVDHSRTSPDGRYRLTLQIDGNVVLYGPRDRALWASHTDDGSGQRLVLGTDGDLVLFDGEGRRVWWTGTEGNPGAVLRVTDQGTIVLYSIYDQPILTRPEPPTPEPGQPGEPA